MAVPTLSIPEPKPLADLVSLRGKCAVVTGGSRGLGEAMVRRLTEAGASVVLTGRDDDALRRVQEDVRAAGGVATGVQADVADLDAARRVIDLAVERFGGVDVLVNNAATFQSCLSVDVTPEFWDHTLDTDLRGAFFLSQFTAEAMIKQGRGGRIINLLSVDAFKPMGFLVAYDAAKAGLWAVTRSMAKEFAEHGILVNSIAPGATITSERIAKLAAGTFAQDQVAPGAVRTKEKVETMRNSGQVTQVLTNLPLGRPGYPDDIANAVLFFASEMGSYVSGVNLTVDGGQGLR